MYNADDHATHHSRHPDDVVLVFTTWPDDAEREAAAARHVVEAGLAACVTRLPRHRVVYRWQGAIEEAEEHQWVIKTTRGRLAPLWDAIRAGHPYDTPEWLVVETSGGSEAYVRWVREMTHGA